jgi:hypothetical protein
MMRPWSHDAGLMNFGPVGVRVVGQAGDAARLGDKGSPLALIHPPKMIRFATKMRCTLSSPLAPAWRSIIAGAQHDPSLWRVHSFDVQESTISPTSFGLEKSATYSVQK